MKTVLICDDDKGILEVIKIILVNNQYQVLTASNFLQIKKVIQSTTPDIILLDIWLSGFDGRDIVKELKQNYLTKNIPILFMSALNETKDIASSSGVQGFINKPFEMDELLKTIKKFIK